MLRITLLSALCIALTGCAATDSPQARGSAGPSARSATFDVRHELTVKVPEGARRVRVWFAIPQDDPAQDISNFAVQAPYPYRLERDSEGNKTLYLEAEAPTDKQVAIVTTFTVTRREVRSGVDASKFSRDLTDAERTSMAHYLEPNTYVIIDDRIKQLAGEIVGDERNTVIAARKIYDWELENIDYWVKDPKTKKASPVGSTEHCLTTKTGNCTDFHSLWASLARAKGIPTRIVYGSFLKKELDGQDVDASYHCWPEFYVADFGWVPHDVAVADIFDGQFPLNEDNAEKVRRTTGDGYRGPDAARVNYYFGNLDERRVVLSSGRDLNLLPTPEHSPVNALPKAFVEIDGQIAPEKDAWVRKLTYHEHQDRR